MVSRYDADHRSIGMRAVVLRELGQPTTVEKLALRPLDRHEVRVQLAASGVCHSDLSLRDGSIPPLLPCTLGHEGAGVVTEVGDDVTNVGPGQHVVLTWLVACPSCAHCLRDESQPLDHAALLGCGLTTGVGAVMRTAAVRPGESVLVIGCGGVGLAAIQGARLAGAAPIIAADRVAAQLPAAIANGATDTIDASEVDLTSAVRDLTGGAGVD